MPKIDRATESASDLYEIDPREIEPGEQRKKLPRNGTKLAGAVPVRFTAETIEEIKRIADAEHVTVSAWIRREVESALRRHRPLTYNATVVPIRPELILDAERRDLLLVAGV